MPRARRAPRLVAALRAERRTLRQGVVALILSTAAGFVAGLILSHITGTLARLPGLLVLIPAAVGMRGTIFGALEARLGTSIHAGLFHASLRHGGVLQDNVTVAIVTTLTSSLWLAVLAKVASTVFGDPSISIAELVVISVVGGSLGSVVILVITVLLSVASFRRGGSRCGRDADRDRARRRRHPADAVPGLLAGPRRPRRRRGRDRMRRRRGVERRAAARSDRPDVRRIVLHMVAVIALTPLLDIAAGGLLGRFQAELIRSAGILILIPPFVSQSGALGGILASRLSSKIQLGLVHPTWWPDASAWVDAAIVSVLAIVTYVVVGSGATLLAELTTRAHPGAGAMVGGTLIAGLLLLPLIVGLSYGVATATTRFGLDPDDHSVPVITSCMDLAGVIAVLASMTLVGALPR